MAEAKRPSPVKLVIGAIASGEGILIKAKKRLERKFGPIDFQGPIAPFDFTKYYEEEMGTNLLRQFLSFQRLINPKQLAAIKLYTNRQEQRLSCAKGSPARDPSLLQDRPSPSRSGGRSGGREINLDPGYICTAKLVLATCKNYAHRIYLDKGIYAEVTLHFQDGTFLPQPWTYRDYKTKDHIQSFNTIREIYLKQLPR